MRHRLNKEALMRWYLHERRSLFDIARISGWPYGVVKDSCIKYGITLRPKTGRKKINIEKSVLQKLYLKEKRTLREVADFFSCGHITIIKRCKEYNIPLRRSNRRKIEALSPRLLHLWYIEKGKTTREIARLIGCSKMPVVQRCKKFGIPLRSPRLLRIKMREETLRRLCVTEGRSIAEIARIVGCSDGVISRRVKRLGLDQQKREGR